MAIDIVPSNPITENTRDNEQKKFAENQFGKVVVRVEDESAAAILNAILLQLGGVAGIPFYSENQILTNGLLQPVITEVVPVGKTRSLTQVVVSCRQPGIFFVKINGTIVGTGRTGAGNPNANFIWMPSRAAVAGDTITVEFIQSYGPSGSDVEAYLMGTDI